MLCEAPALDVLHREVRSPAVVARSVYLDDVRMSQPRNGLGLAQESFPFHDMSRRAGQQHLDRDDAIERQMPGLINNSHPAPPKNALDLVVGNAGHLRLGTWRRR